MNTLAPFAAVISPPFSSANANSNVDGLATTLAPYSPAAMLSYVTVSAVTLNCAPPIGRFTLLGSRTITGTATVSPGCASTSWISHATAPSGSEITEVVLSLTGYVVVVSVVVDVDVDVVSVSVDTVVFVVVSVESVVVVDVDVVVSSSTMIAPFMKLILAVISSPFESDTNASVHSTGYLPGFAFSATL